eukprot:1772824-Prorocentrum_lima.AAC.1
MTSSLVGSEMCIRDRAVAVGHSRLSVATAVVRGRLGSLLRAPHRWHWACLLYTSDAADDM